MTLTEEVIKQIISKLLRSEDYRSEIIKLINAEFLQYVIDFFKKIVEAKLKNENITVDWYKKEFLSDDLPADEIAINAGLNKKTISNMYNSARRKVVIEASNVHYEQLYESIKSLIDSEEEINITLSVKLNQVSVELNISESLIVINTLAVKRAALRGGLWSTAGKRVEKPLMQTLCMLYGVPESNYKIIPKSKKTREPSFEREIDFYLNSNGNFYKCEVKLMGKGNPESADAIFARKSHIFIADKLSNTNKNQLNDSGVEWIELRSPNGYKRFQSVLDNLKIPYTKTGDFTKKDIDDIFNSIFTKTN